MISFVARVTPRVEALSKFSRHSRILRARYTSGMRVPIQEEVLEIRSRVVGVKHCRGTTSTWEIKGTVDISIGESSSVNFSFFPYLFLLSLSSLFLFKIIFNIRLMQKNLF